MGFGIDLSVNMDDLSIEVSMGMQTNKTKSEINKQYKSLKDRKAIVSKFVVFDVETTGLSPEHDEIIEIGAVKIEDFNNESHQTFSCLIKPSKKISSRITDITGITNEMLSKEKTMDEVIHSLYQFIGDFPLVAHNASFDMRFLDATFTKYGLELKNDSIDTLVMARKAFPELDNHKLPTLSNHLKIETIAHRALEDSLATLEVYKSAVKNLYGLDFFKDFYLITSHCNIYRSITEPIRVNIDYNQKHKGDDKGLIAAWELGRILSISNPELSHKAKQGELPKLSFKGGHEKELQNKVKFGVFAYLAKLQGLKGEDLVIDTMKLDGTKMVCSKTNMVTIFVANMNNFRD